MKKKVKGAWRIVAAIAMTVTAAMCFVAAAGCVAAVPFLVWLYGQVVFGYSMAVMLLLLMGYGLFCELGRRAMDSFRSVNGLAPYDWEAK